MKLRKRIFGRRIRDVEHSLNVLVEEAHFNEQYLQRIHLEERENLQKLLAEEDQLWNEIVTYQERAAKLLAGEEVGEWGATGEQEEITEIVGKPVSRIGELLIEQRAITEEQLAEAIEYQAQHGGRLGDVLVELGFIDYSTLSETVEQRRPQKARLGDLLLQSGLITKEQLKSAIEFQKKSGGLLGDILTSLRLVEPEQLYRLIATQQGLGRIGTNILEEDVLKLPESLARSLDAIVVADRATRYLVAVSSQLSDQQTEILERTLGRPIEQVLATREEMELLWKQVYPEVLAEISTNALLKEQPENSAHQTFTKGQLIAVACMGAATVGCLIWDWMKTLIVLNSLIQIVYFTMTLFKFWIIMKGSQRTAQMRFTDEEIASLDEKELPVYTILVPMYKESQVIPHLVKNLENLDYPKAKLDIRMLLEEDDSESIELLEQMKLPPYFTTVVVPHSLPKTKPKACNYGLIRARGEYIVIYDAEDRPDPDQLKKVYASFSRLPDEYVCVQAKLNYFNSEQNLLTRWFTQEYSMWFELLLPGIMQLNVPIPLGGTSNHFKMKALKEINAWDPYNVTEDADLGVRLYKAGYKTAIVDSRTWEEANSKVGNWIRQRSRWIKGYMQTWLVHMRNPFRLWKEIGTQGFWGFQVMVFATPALPLLNPLFWLMLVLWYGWHAGFIPTFFPGAIYYISAVEFIFGNFLFVYSNISGMYCVIADMHRKGDMTFSYRLIKFALLTPIYWVLMSIAALKALWQLITKPFYWEKTNHGLTNETSGSYREEVSI